MGGIYAVISYILAYLTQEIINTIIFLVLLITIVVLMFKKSFSTLILLEHKYPRLNFYIMSLGGVECIGLIAISMLAIIYGYNVYFSQYNNREYISIIPLYLSYASIFYKATLGIAIAWATYVSFIKNRK